MGVQMWNPTTALQFLHFSHYDWWWPAALFLSTSQTFPAVNLQQLGPGNRAAMTEEPIPLRSLPGLLPVRCWDAVKCAVNQEGAERCSCRHLLLFSSSSSSPSSPDLDVTGEASSSAAAWFTLAFSSADKAISAALGENRWRPTTRSPFSHSPRITSWAPLS